MFLASLVVLTEKTLFGNFKNLSAVSLTFRFFAACLTFIGAIWQILTSGLAYFVRLYLESQYFFCGFSSTASCNRCFVELCHI